MILRHLTLHEFRNYRALRQEFSPALNVFTGLNAQGKSNVLEAICLLATSKSMRGSKDVDLIRWDAPAALVSGEVLREKAADIELEVSLSRTAPKSLIANTVRCRRANEFVGQFKAVAFSSTDVEMLREEPARRRRFLDLEISQLSPNYCHALACYRKVVEQRNRLFKQLREAGRFGTSRSALIETLAAWTDQMVAYGSRIVERRVQFIEQLAEFAHPLHENLTQGDERLSISYQPSFPPGGSDMETIQAAYTTALSHVVEEERRRQVSLLGPHRDDVLFLVNGRDVRVYGSQGQQRTAALTARLAEVELMRELSGEAPVVLLDDVFSELDERRRRHLFAVTMQHQTFISTTDLGFIPAAVRKRGMHFVVQDGTLTTAGPGVAGGAA